MTPKRKKAAKRKARHAPRSGQAQAPAPFRMVVAAHPASGISIAPELGLVKAALLYGDRVTLLSPAATMLMRVRGVGSLSPRQLLELLRRLAPYLAQPEQDVSEFKLGLDRLDEALQLGNDATASTRLRVRAELTRQLEPHRQGLADVIDDMTADAGIEQLVRAQRQGLVKLESVDVGDTLDVVAACVIAARCAQSGQNNDDGHTDHVVTAFVDQLARYLSSGRDYLIFDDEIASLTDAAIREGVFTPASGTAGRSAQAMSASGFMSRLPVFPHASVDEVLDIRTELAPCLTPFRAAMVNVARSFTSEAWDVGFEDEVHDAWVEMICPAVEAIESSIRENRSLLSIASGIAGAANLSLPGIAIVGAGMAGHASAVSALGGALSASAPILQAFRDRRSSDQEIRMQPFYFLYGLQGSLGEV